MKEYRVHVPVPFFTVANNSGETTLEGIVPPIVKSLPNGNRANADPLSISFVLVRTTPTSIVLTVNVSSEATVWCGAWGMGTPINTIDLMKQNPGEAIQCSFLILF